MKEQDKQQHHQTQLGRRQFLAGVAGAVPATAVVATLPGAVMAAPADEPMGKEASKGYRLTPHILAYYKSAAR